MKTYLVGGAVRDKLLGRPIKERDFVVVGATPEQMLELGFKKVGKEFPVFLHPQTKEEYALARTERKTGKGYTGFECFFDPNVTLEDDLKRRDLTINAIAEDENGNIIDPYNGREDLKNKILCHVSDAFAEDPVRILRLARFAAKFSDFTVHPSTIALMKQMLEKGEVDALVPERVWQELVRALSENNPERFFEVLNDCGVLAKLFPEIHRSFPSAKRSLQNAVKLSLKAEVRFASLLHQLTKQELNNFCKRLKAPAKYQKLASLGITYKDLFQKADKLSAEEILGLLEKLDAFRKPERFHDFLSAEEAIFNYDNKFSIEHQKLGEAFNKSSKIDIKKLIADQELSGEEIKNIVHKARLARIEE